jgi:hypothetical protein
MTVTDEDVEARKTKPWPLSGYAPGYYHCRCVTCSKVFEGDKRAVECLECAASAANAALQAYASRKATGAENAQVEPVGKWEIDRSTESPILVYDKCSVIQDEQAFYVLGLIRRAHPPSADAEGLREARIDRLRSALSNIIHTFTEDSHGGTKTLPADDYQYMALNALNEDDALAAQSPPEPGEKL